MRIGYGMQQGGISPPGISAPPEHPESGRRGPRGPRPPTPPYVRFRIRRFLPFRALLTSSPAVFERPTLPRGFRPLLPASRPSFEASAQDQQRVRLALLQQVRPFAGRLFRLLRPRLTSADPSRPLTASVAQGRSTDLPG